VIDRIPNLALPEQPQAAGHCGTGVRSVPQSEKGTEMPGNPRGMITLAERRFPVRIRIAIPPKGLGQRHTQMTNWLDENCGADGWAMTPSGTRGVLNDALSIYFADATLARAFVARCRGQGRDGRWGVPGARG